MGRDLRRSLPDPPCLVLALLRTGLPAQLLVGSVVSAPGFSFFRDQFSLSPPLLSPAMRVPRPAPLLLASGAVLALGYLFMWSLGRAYRR